MSDTRKLVALFVVVMGLGVIIFGTVRGLTSTGLARGTRLIVTGEVADVRKAVGSHGRVIPAGGETVVVEVAQRDPAIEKQLHVVRADDFTRATGFLPRAWPFFAVGAVMLLGAGAIARVRT
jgi:hypothetical protein